MKPRDLSESEYNMQQVVQFLESMPATDVPDDFGARVIAKLPVRSARAAHLPRLRANAGLRCLHVSLVVVLGLAFAAAPHATTGAHVWQAVEWAACLQLFALVALTGIFRRVLPR